MAELGEELRRERVRRNLTFKDVEQVLHIKTTYLEAIEDGKYDIIPGQVYVKGFIRNYGNYLDLDGDRLVKAYQSQVGDIDTFSLRSVTRQKAQAAPNLVQSEFVEYQTSKKRMSLETRQRKRQRSIVQERIILGIIFVVLFIWRQERLETPLLSFKVFKNSQFTVGIAIMAVTMISMIGSETVLPMFVQNVLQRTPVDSGLILLPGAIVMAIMSIISGRLYETFGARVLSMIGMLIVTITTSYFVVMDEHTSTIVLATIYAIRMIGIALGLMPVMTHTMNQLTPELNAHGSSMTNTIQQVAGSIGTAGLVTILSVASQHFKPTPSDYQGMAKTEMMKHIQTDAMIHGYHSGFLFAVIITVVSLLLTFLLKRKKDLNEESH